MIGYFVITSTFRAEIREKKLHFNIIFHISLQVATSEMAIHGQMMSYQIFSGTVHLRLFKFIFH